MFATNGLRNFDIKDTNYKKEPKYSYPGSFI